MCIPSIPFGGLGGKSFKITCAADGILSYSITSYSDRGCATQQGSAVSFTPASTNACSSFSQPQLYGVPLLGNYVVGYCQTSPAITSTTTTVIAATQKLSGTITDTPTFRSSFIASVKLALIAQCSTCTVTIVSVTVTSSRRTMVRQLLAAGATVVYNVAAPTATVTAAALQSAVTSPITATALSAALIAANIPGVTGVTATAPTVTIVTSAAGSPTPSPTKVNSSAKTVGNQIVTLCIALCVALCVTLYA